MDVDSGHSSLGGEDRTKWGTVRGMLPFFSLILFLYKFAWNGGDGGGGVTLPLCTVRIMVNSSQVVKEGPVEFIVTHSSCGILGKNRCISFGQVQAGLRALHL